jgi:hypothetical protein
MRALQKWPVVLALMVSIATPWTLLQSAAWFGMLISYSRVASLSKAIEMTFDGEHPCQLCKYVRQGQQEEREQKPITNCSDTKFQLALPPVAVVCFYPPSPHQVYQLPQFPGQRLLRPPTPPPRLA